MKQNTDDTGIFSSRLRFFLSSKFYFIPFFYIFPYLLLELELVWVRHNFFLKKKLIFGRRFFKWCFFSSGQELALNYLGLKDYLLFAPRDSLIGANKEGIISLPGKKKNRKCRYSNLIKLVLLSRLSRHPASGVVCRYHYSTTFPIFFPSSTKDAHQQGL